ncbi:hypothetical protein PO124_18380 [Bacillus licheniformis]|nr:hypothetical protein [Bacillus licheniformis]
MTEQLMKEQIVTEINVVGKKGKAIKGSKKDLKEFETAKMCPRLSSAQTCSHLLKQNWATGPIIKCRILQLPTWPLSKSQYQTRSRPRSENTE